MICQTCKIQYDKSHQCSRFIEGEQAYDTSIRSTVRLHERFLVGKTWYWTTKYYPVRVIDERCLKKLHEVRQSPDNGHRHDKECKAGL